MPDDVMDLQNDVADDVADPEPDVDVDEGDEEASDEEGTADSDEDGSEDEPEADDAEDSDDDDEDEPAPAKKGGSAKLDKLLQKYNGDPDKMVDAYFEQANSMSRLFQKLTDLEKKLEQKAADPEEEAKYVASDSEVKEYAAELTQLDGQIKETQRNQTVLVGEFGKVDKLISKLEGKLEAASIEDRAEIKEELAEAKARQRELQSDWKESQRELSKLERDIKDAARKYRAAEAAAKTRRGVEKQREVDAVHAQRVTQAEFLTTVKAEAQKYGLSPGTKTFDVVQQAVKDRIVTYLRSLPPSSKAINIPNAVSKLMAEYADALELKSRFKKVSKQKVEQFGQQGPKGKASADNKSNLSPKDAQYWRDRARRLAG